jgi:hypothetical protein
MSGTATTQGEVVAVEATASVLVAYGDAEG